jgi:hypothetical protein
MLIFFDSEFTDLVATPRLVSMGFVAESNRSFYAEPTDTYKLKDCSEFVVDRVMPWLEGGAAAMTQKELKDRLKTWIESFDEPVQIAVDSLCWDWSWILWAFKEANSWPANLADHPALLTTNYLDNFDRFESELEAAFESGCEGPDLRRHHALDDAKANLIAFRKSGGFECDNLRNAAMNRGN